MNDTCNCVETENNKSWSKQIRAIAWRPKITSHGRNKVSQMSSQWCSKLSRFNSTDKNFKDEFGFALQLSMFQVLLLRFCLHFIIEYAPLDYPPPPCLFPP